MNTKNTNEIENIDIDDGKVYNLYIDYLCNIHATKISDEQIINSNKINNENLSKYNNFISSEDMERTIKGIYGIDNEKLTLPSKIIEWRENADYKTSFKVGNQIYSFTSKELFEEYNNIIQGKDLNNKINNDELVKIYKKKVIANVLYQEHKYNVEKICLDRNFYEYDYRDEEFKNLYSSVEKKFKDFKLINDDDKEYSFKGTNTVYKGDTYKYLICATGETALTTQTLINKYGKGLNFCSNCNIPFDSSICKNYIQAQFHNNFTQDAKEMIEARWIGEFYNANKDGIRFFNLSIPSVRFPNESQGYSTEDSSTFLKYNINTAIDLCEEYNKNNNCNKKICINGKKYEKYINENNKKCCKILKGFPININANFTDYDDYISKLISFSGENIKFKENDSRICPSDISLNTFISHTYPLGGHSICLRSIDPTNDGTNMLKFLYFTSPCIANPVFMGKMKKLIDEKNKIEKDNEIEENNEIEEEKDNKDIPINYFTIIKSINSSLGLDDRKSFYPFQLLKLFADKQITIEETNANIPNKSNSKIYKINLIDKNNESLYISIQDSRKGNRKSIYIGSGEFLENGDFKKEKGILISPSKDRIFLYNNDRRLKNDKNYSINDLKEALESKSKGEAYSVGCFTSEIITDNISNFFANNIFKNQTNQPKIYNHK